MIPIHNNPHITALYTAFRRDCSKDFFFRGESHDFYELVCVAEGKAGITADHRIFELQQGEAILHPPMQFHNVYSTGGTAPVIYVFSFAGEHIPKLENAICKIEDLSQVKALLELCRRTLRMKSDTVQEIKSGEHLQFVKQLELLLLQLSHPTKQQAATQSAKNYAAIMQTLQQNLYRRLTVKELAALCNMSEVNLQKTFSRYAGVGVMEHFTRTKMQQAAELLRQGCTVKETALRFGYPDQNYFSTAFKRITGHPPSWFKNNKNTL
ncbi:MAG: helix-turn-helix transcriptional regulator [Clostridia bacterium]|nr:helix-turn-helix transcriptional regulator [Clostridia bacterium]